MIESYLLYVEELKKWNARINLTALTEDLEIGVKHFLDSLTVAPYLHEAKRVLDIGAEAGFPGLPLKILSAAIALLLLEASPKKVFFLRNIVRILKLSDSDKNSLFELDMTFTFPGPSNNEPFGCLRRDRTVYPLVGSDPPPRDSDPGTCTREAD